MRKPRAAAVEGDGAAVETAHPTRPSVDAMRELRRKGMTYQEISDRVGLSREHVRRLILQSSAGKPDGRRRKARTREREQTAAEAVQWVTGRGPTSRASVKKRFGLSESEMAFVMSRLPRHLVFYTTTGHGDGVDPATVPATLRRVWSILQHEHTGLSRALYDRARDEHEPSSAAIITYRTWVELCQDAGVPPGRRSRASEAYEDRWTAAELLAALNRYLEHCAGTGEHATVRGYDRFQRADSALPSPKTILMRLRRAHGINGWPDALQLALDHQTSRCR